MEISETGDYGRQVLFGGTGGTGEMGWGGVLSVVISAVCTLACVSRLLVSGWWRALRRKAAVLKWLLEGGTVPGFAQSGNSVQK